MPCYYVSASGLSVGLALAGPAHIGHTSILAWKGPSAVYRKRLIQERVQSSLLVHFRSSFCLVAGAVRVGGSLKG